MPGLVNHGIAPLVVDFNYPYHLIIPAIVFQFFSYHSGSRGESVVGPYVWTCDLVGLSRMVSSDVSFEPP